MRSSALLKGLAVALGALVLLFGVLSVQRLRDRPDVVPPPASLAQPALSDAPVRDAEAAAKNFFSLDYRTVDEDVARVLATATGEFETQYREKSVALAQDVRSKKLVITASVPESGAALEYFTATEARLLVAVDVHTEGKGVAAPDGRYRTRVVLLRSGDSWLVARLEQVG